MRFIVVPLVIALAVLPALTVLPHILVEEDSESSQIEVETERKLVAHRPRRASRVRTSPPRRTPPRAVAHRASRHGGALLFNPRTGRPAVPPPLVC